MSKGRGLQEDASSAMKVAFRQTGGFGGLSLAADLDTARLSAAEARELERLVAQSDLRALSAKGPASARDLTTYEITVESADGVVRATFDDMTVPAQLEPLLEHLRAQARPRSLGTQP
jgi:hypothetical protein